MISRKTKNITEWEEFSHLFKRQEIPVKTTLLQEDEISKSAYLVEKGYLKLPHGIQKSEALQRIRTLYSFLLGTEGKRI